MGGSLRRPNGTLNGTYRDCLSRSRMSVMAIDRLVLFVVGIGIGATAVLDLWALLLKLVFDFPLPNYCLVGRWFRYIPQGVFHHRSIAASPGKSHECVVGWIAHYLIGAAFAVGLVAVAPRDWLKQPTLWPPLLFGLVTVAVPYFVMQPAFGLGIAASKAPDPTQARVRSLMAHVVFGIGLYVSARILRTLIG